MCDPITVSTVATVGSVGLDIWSQYEQMRNQERSTQAMASYNSQVAANDAAMQQRLAQNEIAKGVADRERQQRQAARAMGDMRAEMAASGFEIDSGSNLSLLAESAGEHQYDSAVITSNADQAAWQHQVAATNALNQKSLYDWQYANAKSGRLGTYLGMGGSLLGGIGKGIGAYASMPGGVAGGSSSMSSFGPYASGYKFPVR